MMVFIGFVLLELFLIYVGQYDPQEYPLIFGGMKFISLLFTIIVTLVLIQKCNPAWMWQTSLFVVIPARGFITIVLGNRGDKSEMIKKMLIPFAVCILIWAIIINPVNLF